MKKNFYAGFEMINKAGEKVTFENHYGPIRTTYLITCMLLGGAVIGIGVAEGISKGIEFTANKIKEHKMKKIANELEEINNKAESR